MKVCKNFIEKPEATTCQNCGYEKWEHYDTVADVLNAIFAKLAKERLKADMENAAFIQVLNPVEEPTLGFVNTEKLCNSEEVKAFEQIMEAGILKYKKKRNGKK